MLRKRCSNTVKRCSNTVQGSPAVFVVVCKQPLSKLFCTMFFLLPHRTHTPPQSSFQHKRHRWDLVNHNFVMRSHTHTHRPTLVYSANPTACEHVQMLFLTKPQHHTGHWHAWLLELKLNQQRQRLFKLSAPRSSRPQQHHNRQQQPAWGIMPSHPPHQLSQLHSPSPPLNQPAATSQQPICISQHPWCYPSGPDVHWLLTVRVQQCDSGVQLGFEWDTVLFSSSERGWKRYAKQLHRCNRGGGVGSLAADWNWDVAVHQVSGLL